MGAHGPASLYGSHPVAKTYSLSPRQLSWDDSWDVIVIGGGTAGCTAAAAAAREGARTLLVEQTGSLGGMGTSGLVPAWTPFSDKEKIIYRGMAEKVFEATKKNQAHIEPGALDWVAIDPERLKRIYDELVASHGAKVLFNTFMSSVETESGHVRAVVISNKAGLSALSAKIYVDATGDADLAAWAGAPFLKGDEQGKGLMPATHCFALANVNTEAYLKMNCHGASPDSPIHAILASKRYPLLPDVHLCSNIIGPGTVGFNAGHVYGVDATIPQSTSEGLVLGRKIAAQYRDALAEFAPAAFGNAYLVMTGSLLGIRETRRIVGDYVLTLEDYLRRRSFDDDIARNSYFIDVHPNVKEAVNSLAGAWKCEEKAFRYGAGETHGIPYRCLLPRTLCNVLVAGRSISAEQLVQGSVRVMPCCLAMGEAAGLAAAMAAVKSSDTRSISVSDLQRALRGYGAYLPEAAPSMV